MVRPRRDEPGHQKANEKWHKTMIKRFGSEEKMKEFFRRIGSRGGQNGHTGGFNSEKVGADGLTGFERARIAGSRGGKISRRTKKNDHDERA